MDRTVSSRVPFTRNGVWAKSMSGRRKDSARKSLSVVCFKSVVSCGSNAKIIIKVQKWEGLTI